MTYLAIFNYIFKKSFYKLYFFNKIRKNYLILHSISLN